MQLHRVFSVLFMFPIITAALVMGLSFPPAHALSPPEHVVIVVLDGFRPDYIDMYDTPALRRLRDDGAWVAQAHGVFPANSTVNQTSLVTGAYPATTGIANNTQFNRTTEQFIEGPRDNRATTISEVFRNAGLFTLSVNHYMLQGKTDLYGTHFNDVLMTLAAPKKPVLTVYLNLAVDAAGHRHGPYNPQTGLAVTQADAEIGRLLNVLESEGMLQNTLIVVASDHGMSAGGGKEPVPGLDYVLWRQGFNVAKSAADIHPDTDLIQIQLGSSFFYFRDGKYTDERYRQLLTALENVEGIDVYSSQRLQHLHTDPHLVGDIVVAPIPGYTLYPGNANSGIHGRPTEQQITLLLYGPGIKKGVIVPEASIIDVVPTILHLFQLPIPETVDGHVITAALQ